MKTIRILIAFARSGGTLANQLIGVHPDCLVLSEVNPAASVVPLPRQAADWLGLIEPSEMRQFAELTYSRQITLLDERATAKGKILVVRDWVSVNYLMGAGGDIVVPSGVLEQFFYLEQAGYSMLPVVITRGAVDVYQSIRRTIDQLALLPLDEFARAYLAFARAVAQFPRVALDALQTEPRSALLQLLQALNLPAEHVDGQLALFPTYNKCTGNNTLRKPVKTSQAHQIMPATIYPGLAADASDQSRIALAEADGLLGYHT